MSRPRFRPGNPLKYNVKVKIQDKKVRPKFIFMLYIFLVAYPIDMYVCS